MKSFNTNQVTKSDCPIIYPISLHPPPPLKSTLTIILKLVSSLILPSKKRKIGLRIELMKRTSYLSRVKKGRNRADIKGVVTIGIPKKIIERGNVRVYTYISNNETGILGYSNFLVAWRTAVQNIEYSGV